MVLMKTADMPTRKTYIGHKPFAHDSSPPLVTLIRMGAFNSGYMPSPSATIYPAKRYAPHFRRVMIREDGYCGNQSY